MATTAHDVIRSTRRVAAEHGFDLAALRDQLDRVLRGARSAGSAAGQGFLATDRYVQRHPWTAIAIVAGAMALAGLALAGVFRGERAKPGVKQAARPRTRPTARRRAT